MLWIPWIGQLKKRKTAGRGAPALCALRGAPCTVYVVCGFMWWVWVSICALGPLSCCCSICCLLSLATVYCHITHGTWYIATATVRQRYTHTRSVPWFLYQSLLSSLSETSKLLSACFITRHSQCARTSGACGWGTAARCPSAAPGAAPLECGAAAAGPSPPQRSSPPAWGRPR